MRMPSKVTPYKNSTLAKFPIVLRELQKWSAITPDMLYRAVKGKSFDITDFIEVMDYLFMLGKVDFIPGRGLLVYVEENQL